MSSPIYQYVINLIVSLPMRKGPGVVMNVSAWEHQAYNNQIFDVAELTNLTPLSLPSCCKLSFSAIGLKIFSLTSSDLKSSNRIFISYLGK